MAFVFLFYENVTTIAFYNRRNKTKTCVFVY